jgi:hypothetical protein
MKQQSAIFSGSPETPECKPFVLDVKVEYAG